ncbi:hypothetical protein K1719_025209 [Acacia pycnantha]|nr:hypothetical protein K1719_025209 [Acacia pycnantha]
MQEMSLRSPEAKLGLRVEDLWDVQEPQLNPTEKPNACFENIPVFAFPLASSNQVIEIKSYTTLSKAVKILTQHNILSALVVDVEASEDATWMDRYIGIVEFAGIVVWILQQTEGPRPSSFLRITTFLGVDRHQTGENWKLLSPVTSSSDFSGDLLLSSELV